MPDYPQPSPDVSTTLDVSGGSTSVSTDDLDFSAGQLAALAAEAAAMSACLARLVLPSTAGSIYGDQARVDTELATSRLHEISQRADHLQGVLRTAARGYETTERVIGVVSQLIQGAVLQEVGSQLGRLLLPSGMLISVAGGLWLSLRAAVGKDGAFLGGLGQGGGAPSAGASAKAPGAGAATKAGVVNDALTASTVRALAESLGPVLLGASGAPPFATYLMGSRTYEFGARGLVAAGQSVGLFEETRVKLVETIERPVGDPPRTYEDRLERVPYFTEATGAQVHIEKYTVPGEVDRFTVSIGGTVSFSPEATTEPWDLTSNVINAAGGESGSMASVREAMEEAGITADSPVQFAGYSQGGGTAARLAASGDYNTQGLVTFGGPTGEVRLPEDFPAVLVEHADDLVPALGGYQHNDAAVLVRRDVFADGVTDDRYDVPSHHIEYYLQTAKLMDESHSHQLDTTLERLNSFTDGATLESSTDYRFERAD
ncbi:hypothetical protein BH09ACT5_BH09ACT5_11570 [soil metagenome]